MKNICTNFKVQVSPEVVDEQLHGQDTVPHRIVSALIECESKTNKNKSEAIV